MRLCSSVSLSGASGVKRWRNSRLPPFDLGYDPEGASNGEYSSRKLHRSGILAGAVLLWARFE
jgi:hypothetical protein